MRPFKLLCTTALFLAFVTSQTGFSLERGHHPEYDPLPTATYVDIDRYMGRWFEIARLPDPYDKSCVGNTADYSRRSTRRIRMRNTCRRVSCAARVDTDTASGKILDTFSNAKLRVRTSLLHSEPYWILEVDPDYQYAVVGNPNRHRLWILSRTQNFNDLLYANLQAKYRELGFPTELLIRTTQCNQ